MRKWMTMLAAALLMLGMLAGGAQAEVEGYELDAVLSEPGADAITVEEAAEIARPVWEKTVGTADDWERYIEYVPTFIEIAQDDGSTRPAWALRLYDRNGAYLSCLVMIDAETGEVISTQAFEWFELEVAYNNAGNSRFFWSLEDLELFFHLYLKTDYDDLYASQPGPDHVSKEEAEQIALDAVVEHCGVTAESLALLPKEVAFYEFIGSEEEQYADDYWTICYRTLLQQEDSFHGIMYQVNLSAKTGELMLVGDNNTIYYPEYSTGGQG